MITTLIQFFICKNKILLNNFNILALWVSILALSVTTNLKSQNFKHPGCTVSKSDLERWRAKVLAKESPWIDGYNLMVADKNSGSWNNAVPNTTIGGNNIRQRASFDANMAYLNTLRFYVSGDVAHRDCAVRILDAWSEKVNAVVTGELFMLPAWAMADAGELLHGVYPEWPNFERFKNMCVNFIYPACEGFTKNCGSWPGWDGPANVACLEIAVLADDTAKFNKAIAYFKNGEGGGCITNAILPSGQITEMGRDQPHAEIGPNAFADVCQIAWNQGIDLYSFADNRLMKGFEYFRKYNLNHAVDWESLADDCSGQNFYYPALKWHNRIYGSGERVYNHYTVVKKLQMPYTRTMLKHVGIQLLTGLATYSDTSTLYVACPTPAAPSSLTAISRIDDVFLKWSAPQGDLASGYKVYRSDFSSGTYQEIASWTDNTTTEYADTSLSDTKTMFYKVVALNSSGKSDFSNVASAAMASADTVLPRDWTFSEIGSATGGKITYANINQNNTFTLKANGIDVWNPDNFSFASTPVSGDFTIIARLYDVRPNVNTTYGPQDPNEIKTNYGIMLRENFDPKSCNVAIGLGGTGTRGVGITQRTTNGGNTSFVAGGDSHTWMPVWLKLERIGNQFNGYQSQDGLKWFLVGTTTLAMKSSYNIGFYGVRTRDKFAYFDNVNVFATCTSNCVTVITDEFSEQKPVAIYPNPSKFGFNVKTTDNAEIQVMDLDGKILEVYKNVTSLELGINLRPGIYLLKSDNNVYKLVKD